MRRTCLNKVYDLAKRDPRVVFVGSDLSPGLLSEMQAEMPERYYMEGVAEQNVVGLAAGMALDGFVPYVNTIATFLTRRCFEQVALDVCLHDLPVRLIGNGGGLVYAPLGPTHTAVEDLAILRALPNMTVVAVCDADEMGRLMDASLDWPHPLYIRLAKGGDPVVSRAENGFEIGKGIVLRRDDSGDVLIVTTGVMTTNALVAAGLLATQEIGATVLHLHTVKPLDADLVVREAARHARVATVEEHVATGGLGSAVTDAITLGMRAEAPPMLRLALPDVFPEKYGKQADLWEVYGLLPEQIAASIGEFMG